MKEYSYYIKEDKFVKYDIEANAFLRWDSSDNRFYRSANLFDEYYEACAAFKEIIYSPGIQEFSLGKYHFSLLDTDTTGTNHHVFHYTYESLDYTFCTYLFLFFQERYGLPSNVTCMTGAGKQFNVPTNEFLQTLPNILKEYAGMEDFIIIAEYIGIVLQLGPMQNLLIITYSQNIT